MQETGDTRPFSERVYTAVFWPDAYQEGLRAGKADRALGARSEYSWAGQDLDPRYTYGWHYSRGYRDGLTGR